MITYTNKLDMYPGTVPVVIHLGQYDSDFSLVFDLFSSAGTFTVESSTTAEIRGTKKDGNGYSATATIDISNKRVTVAGNVQMTAISGENVFELVLKKNGKVLSTANFILCVERASMDADTVPSESIIREIGEATSAYLDEHPELVYQVDDTLSITGAAADAAKVGGEIDDLKDDLSHIEPGLSDDAKQALLNCISHIAYWTDGDGSEYYDALEEALYEGRYPRLSASFNSGGEIIYDDYAVEDLRRMLIVKYYRASGDFDIVTNYTLSGSLTTATSTIAISYSGLITTVNIPVVVGRLLTADDILSCIGASGLTVNNGNIDWVSTETFTVLLFKNNIKHVRYTQHKYEQSQVESEPGNILNTAFKQVSNGVYCSSFAGQYVFSLNGSKYDATQASDITMITNQQTGMIYPIGTRVDVTLNNGKLTKLVSVDNYSAIYSVTNAELIGTWWNGGSSQSKFENVRVYEQ